MVKTVRKLKEWDDTTVWDFVLGSVKKPNRALLWVAYLIFAKIMLGDFTISCKVKTEVGEIFWFGLLISASIDLLMLSASFAKNKCCFLNSTLLASTAGLLKSGDSLYSKVALL